MNILKEIQKGNIQDFLAFLYAIRALNYITYSDKAAAAIMAKSLFLVADPLEYSVKHLLNTK